MTKSRSGFTIVELLIVIVVIAILAAISVVAYNGIQTRTTNTKQQQAALGFYKLLQLYKAQNGVYPHTSADASYCLGRNYIDTTGDGIADCGDGGNTQVNTAKMTLLESIGTLPQPNIERYTSSDGDRAGIYIHTGWSGGPVMVAFLKGSAVSLCPIAGATLDPLTGVSTSGGATFCIYKLP